MRSEGDAAGYEEDCYPIDKASTNKDKDSTQVKMACMKNGVLYPTLRLNEVLGGSCHGPTFRVPHGELLGARQRPNKDSHVFRKLNSGCILAKHCKT